MEWLRKKNVPRQASEENKIGNLINENVHGFQFKTCIFNLILSLNITCQF